MDHKNHFTSDGAYKYLTQAARSLIKGSMRTLIAASILLFTGNAYAVITVGLMITNDVDSNGNITVINGSKIKVDYAVTEDTDGDLHKKDRIELRTVDGDELVSFVLRGKKKSGSVNLKVKNSEGEQLYVRYVRKSGTEITRISHPADDDTPLLSIAKANITDLTLGLNAVNVGAVSVPAHAFVNENTDTDQESECQLTYFSQYAFYRSVAGATDAACDSYAPIQLPQGRTLTEFTCTTYDNSGVNTNNISFTLIRVSLISGSISSIFSTAFSADSASIQQLTDSTANPASSTVDNTTYVYRLYANFTSNDFSNLGFNGRIYGCSVSYE